MPLDLDKLGLTIMGKALLQSKKPAITVDLPGYPGTKVALWVPSDEDAAEAQAATLHFLTNGGLKLDEFKLSLAVEGQLYRAEYERQLLVRVMRDPSDPDKPAATIEELRKGFTAQIRDQLMRILERWVDERNPDKSGRMTPEEVVGLLQTLKETGDMPTLLASYATGTVNYMLCILADRYLKPTP